MRYGSSSAAGYGGLPRIGLRIVGAMQPSAKRGTAAESVAIHSRRRRHAGRLLLPTAIVSCVAVQRAK